MDKTWEEISETVLKMAAEQEAGFATETVENALALIAFLKDRYVVADEVGKGYWPTIRFSWSIKPKPIEIEVHQDRYEYYRFSDGQTEMREFSYALGVTFPRELEMILKSIFLENN